SCPNGVKEISALFVLAVFSTALIVGANLLNQTHGYEWAPIAGGALMAIAVLQYYKTGKAIL
ncbi:MAG: hypothetical protein ABGY29_15680, partial [bacterium]